MAKLGRVGGVRLQPLLMEASSAIPLGRSRKLLKCSSLVEQIDLSEIVQEESGKGRLGFAASVRQTHQQLQIKSRFMRMIELQNQSLMQRTQLQKVHFEVIQERVAILKQEEVKVRRRADRIKDERSHSGVTVRNWKVKNMQQGAIVRSAKLHNEYLLAKREIEELRDKKSIVNDIHKTMVVTQGKYAEGRGDAQRNRLRATEEYRCGLIAQIAQIKVTPRSIQKGMVNPIVIDEQSQRL